MADRKNRKAAGRQGVPQQPVPWAVMAKLPVLPGPEFPFRGTRPRTGKADGPSAFKGAGEPSSRR